MKHLDNSIDAKLVEIRAFLAAHGDEKVVAKYSRYFKEGYDAYGIPDGEYRSFAGQWFEANRSELGLSGFLALGDRLMRSGKYEEASLAINWAGRFHKQFSPAEFLRFGAWLQDGVREWAHCDVLCGDLLSIFLVRGIVSIEALAPWRHSESKWQRRAVPVSMISLLKKGHEVQPMLDLIRPMMMDPERVVHQGLGWFLREAWKLHPAAVEEFLLQWKDSAPRLIFQYATEKMTPEAKARFKKQRREPVAGEQQ